MKQQLLLLFEIPETRAELFSDTVGTFPNGIIYCSKRQTGKKTHLGVALDDESLQTSFLQHMATGGFDDLEIVPHSTLEAA